jgi:transcriptional regulator with XRE-family HTH domain
VSPVNSPYEIISPNEVHKLKKYSKHHLRAWRRHRGYTQEFLASMIEKTTITVWRLENQFSGYTQQTLEALAEAPATTPGALLDGPPAA